MFPFLPYSRRRRFEPKQPADATSPTLLIQSTLLNLGPKESEGQIVLAVQLPWREILTRIGQDPAFLHHFAGEGRAFEEFLAGVYHAHGFEVTLTPRTNDGGRDLIATRSGFCSVRILGQAKAYKAGHLVTHSDCRDMIGVLTEDRSASKGMIITTSDFQPTVRTSEKITPFLPGRLELISGKELPEWLGMLGQDSSKPRE